MKSRRWLLGAITGGVFISASAAESFSVGSILRETQSVVASDPDGLVGISDADDGDTVPSFHNNGTTEMVITLDSNDSSVRFDVGNTGTFANAPVTFTLTSGQSEEVAIDANSESATVDIDVTLNGDTIYLKREFGVSQAGQIEVTANVQSSGNSGVYSFGLQNTGTIDATIAKIGIFQTSVGDVVKVGGRNQDDILIHNDDQVVGEIISIDSTNPSNATLRNLNPMVALIAGGPEQVFEFDRFREEDNSNGRMNNAEVEIQLEFTDGSSTSLKLCPGGSCTEI